MKSPKPLVTERTALGLAGLMVDLVTPLRPDRSLDLYALQGLLLHVMSARPTAVCAVGAAGEGPLLPLRVREEATGAVADYLGGSVPVVPLAVGTSVSAVRLEVERLAGAGATAVLASPLSYYPATGAAVLGFYQELAQTAPVPLVLFHSPEHTGVRVPVEVVAALARSGAVAGIHDASGDVEYLSNLMAGTEAIPGFGVVCANDAVLTSSVLSGATGAVSACANLAPQMAAKAYESAVVRSLHTARVAQRGLLGLVGAVHSRGLPYRWKAAAHAAGLCGETAAADGYALGAEDAQRLMSDLASLGVVHPAG